MAKKWINLGGSKNPVGYCHYHKAELSVKQMKSKNCLGKNCKRLEKHEGHPFWKQRIEKENLRKKRKDEEEKYLQNIDKRKLVKLIKYCKNCPEGRDKALEYCSRCEIGGKCMGGIIDLIYEYFTTYEAQTFEEFLQDTDKM